MIFEQCHKFGSPPFTEYNCAAYNSVSLRHLDYTCGHPVPTTHPPVDQPPTQRFRCRLKLAEYDFDVINKAGKMNVNADALSRNPIDD